MIIIIIVTPTSRVAAPRGRDLSRRFPQTPSPSFGSDSGTRIGSSLKSAQCSGRVTKPEWVAAEMWLASSKDPQGFSPHNAKMKILDVTVITIIINMASLLLHNNDNTIIMMTMMMTTTTMMKMTIINTLRRFYL